MMQHGLLLMTSRQEEIKNQKRVYINQKEAEKLFKNRNIVKIMRNMDQMIFLSLK